MTLLKGFCGLLFKVSTKALANRDCSSFNTQTNSIYRFHNCLDSLTLCNARTVTFKPIAVKIRCSWFTPLYICASYSQSLLVVVIIVYSSVFVIIRQLLFVVRLFASLSFEFCFWLLLEKKKSNSEPDPVQVFRSRYELPVSSKEVPSTCWLLPVQHHHHLESINIIQQTPPTLS